MKALKNKEIIIGLILLIVLCVLALILIIKREFPETGKKNVIVTESKETETEWAENEPKITEDDGEKNTESGENALQKEQSTGVMEQLELPRTDKSVAEYYTSPGYLEYDGDEMSQLEELLYYWNEYKLDAVDDLIRLPRLRTAFTNELSGTNGFYYCGSYNAAGQPEGTGVAVYENNAYYCGEWKNGKRSGKGMWLQIFPDKPVVINGVSGVLEHSYNGQWQDDLPNGEGQEHFEYDMEVMEGEDILLNVIGSFKDGYYDGELYIMTIKKDAKTTDWEAAAQRGKFVYVHNRYNTMGKLPVWETLDQDLLKKEDGSEYRWLYESENAGWGIYSLKENN